MATREATAGRPEVRAVPADTWTARCPAVGVTAGHLVVALPRRVRPDSQRRLNARFRSSPPRADRTVTVPAAVGCSAVGVFLSRKSKLQTPRAAVGVVVPSRTGEAPGLFQ